MLDFVPFERGWTLHTRRYSKWKFTPAMWDDKRCVLYFLSNYRLKANNKTNLGLSVCASQWGRKSANVMPNVSYYVSGYSEYLFTLLNFMHWLSCHYRTHVHFDVGQRIYTNKSYWSFQSPHFGFARMYSILSEEVTHYKIPPSAVFISKVCQISEYYISPTHRRR